MTVEWLSPLLLLKCHEVEKHEKSSLVPEKSSLGTPMMMEED